MAQVQSPSSSVASSGDMMNHNALCSLYVGDLDFSVTDSQLYDYFRSVAPVVSVRVCRNVDTNISLGYAYVNFTTTEHAEKALNKLNFTSLNGKMIRVTHSSRDSSARKSGIGNLFVKNLDKSVDNKALHEAFSESGTIVSCKVATDSIGQSRGYGFVQFETDESAKDAIEKLNGKVLNDKPILVEPFLKKEERESAKFTNVYVKNFSDITTDDELKTTFGQYGSIQSALVMRDEDGKSKCFGFVNFENPDDAARAVDALNGKLLNEKELYVCKAQKKAERERELSMRSETSSTHSSVSSYEGLNLYVRNLDETVTEDKLQELFAEFGTVTSCKVLREPDGTSRRSGFVSFSTASEASRVLNEMNGKMVWGKPLYVSLAQRKEERRAQLEARMRPGFVPGMGPHMPIFPGGAPGLGQPVFYRHGPPPPITSHQPGFGYQSQMVHGMRPNFYGPMMHQPAQQGQRPWSGDGQMRPQPQRPMPFMQPQMIPRGRGYGHPPARNMAEGPVQGGMPLGQTSPIAVLGNSLSNASPALQRTLLGETLYPLVDQIEHENVAKVTGMLLEMDQVEILHLIETPAALRAKVSEAMNVLGKGKQPKPPVSEGKATPSDLMAALSI